MSQGAAHLSLREEPAGVLTIVVGGTWRATGDLPSTAGVRSALESRPRQIRFQAEGLDTWDSSLVALIASLTERAGKLGIGVDRSALPGGIRRLLELAETAPVAVVGPKERRPTLLVRVGLWATGKVQTSARVLGLVGETARALGRIVTGRARYRRRELFLLIQLVGAQAFWIVSLVSFLVGLILAFIGAVQLQSFGAVIYVADLVGISMVREMGALLAAIVAAGRTGAAYAAELGTMRGSQEIDALVTLGISPFEFLVGPRIIALTVMLPVLCLYADFMGVLGGAVVGVGTMGISARVYYDETLDAVTVTHLVGGLFKAAVYGALVAGAGCFEGLRAGPSASAVGGAATAAVVDGIVLVIAACGVFAVLFYVLGI